VASSGGKEQSVRHRAPKNPAPLLILELKRQTFGNKKKLLKSLNCLRLKSSSFPHFGGTGLVKKGVKKIS